MAAFKNFVDSCTVPIKRNRSKKRVSKGGLQPNGLYHDVAELFNSFVLVELTEQQLASGDRLHTAFIRSMGAGDPLSLADLHNIQRLSQKDILEGDSWKFAPVLLTSNRERIDINMSQMQRFALHHNECIVRWRMERIWNGPDLEIFPQAEKVPALWCYFVRGAPGYLTRNINPAINLANGTDIE